MTLKGVRWQMNQRQRQSTHTYKKKKKNIKEAEKTNKQPNNQQTNIRITRNAGEIKLIHTKH